jgi:hypothetical protein
VEVEMQTAQSVESQEPESSSQQSSRQSGGEDFLRVMHHHPGYVRAQSSLFVDATEESCSALAAARAVAEASPGFLKWSHNPTTGSVIIEYGVEYGSDSVGPDDLLDQIAESAGLAGVVEDIHSSDHRSRMINGLLDAIQEANQIFYTASGGKADLREFVPATLLLNTVVAFVLGENRGRLPSWDSSLYKAYRIFMQFHKTEVGKREKREKKKKKAKKAA